MKEKGKKRTVQRCQNWG